MSVPSRRGRHALDHGEISLGDAFPIGLQCSLNRGASREEHQARGLAIEAMDDKGLLLARFRQRLQIVIEYAMRSLFLFAIRSHGKQPGGFIDNHEHVVEVDNLET